MSSEVPALTTPVSFAPLPGKHTLTLIYPPLLDEPFPKCPRILPYLRA